MTSIEAYKQFELKLNKLDSADNVDINIGEFVLIFNEQQVKWYENRFRNKSSRFDIDDVQAFVEPDYKVVNPTRNLRHSEFILPANYLDYIRSYSICSKDSCKGRIVRNYQVRLTDTDNYLEDANNEPSFEYKETPVTLAKNKVQVYFTDFVVEELYLTYYRYPTRIDIAGYKRIDGTQSSTVNPELPDEDVNEVIDLCVLEVQRSTENGDGFQLSANRLT